MITEENKESLDDINVEIESEESQNKSIERKKNKINKKDNLKINIEIIHYLIIIAGILITGIYYFLQKKHAPKIEIHQEVTTELMPDLNARWIHVKMKIKNTGNLPFDLSQLKEDEFTVQVQRVLPFREKAKKQIKKMINNKDPYNHLVDWPPPYNCIHYITKQGAIIYPGHDAVFQSDFFIPTDINMIKVVTTIDNKSYKKGYYWYDYIFVRLKKK